jgi:bacteriocin biosynthesis cyclodehydratase domain-containing protein
MSVSSPASEPQPIIRPGLLVLRRTAVPGQVTVQLGLSGEHALLVDVPAGSADPVLHALDGSRTRTEVVARAARDGANPEVAAALLHQLERSGALADARDWSSWTAGCPEPELGRRLADLYAWDHWAGPAGTDVGTVVATRAAGQVRIAGAGRVGAALAVLLAAAGVGRIEIDDPGQVRPADLSPLGYRPDDLGRPRATAAADLIDRWRPRTDPDLRTTARRGQDRRTTGGRDRRTTSGRDGRTENRPDLVVLCPDAPEPDRDVAAALSRASVPHLLVRARESTGIVGPLVLPGRTACVRCTDLHRSDRDPGWPALLAQLTAARATPAETVLAAHLAALAAAQVLHRLAGGDPPTLGHTIEVRLAGGLASTREWPPHPCCGCRWPDQIADSDDLLAGRFG